LFFQAVSNAEKPLTAVVETGLLSRGAIRIDDFKFQFYRQPFGWPSEKTTTDMPTIVNLRQDRAR
jgi:hypothetical protein